MTALALVIDRPRAAGIALIALLAPIALFWSVGSRPTPQDSLAMRRRRRIGALFIGKDGRASTSKVQAVLWTIVIAVV